MSVHQELSRLLEGDLPEAEARELSARIAADPEIAAGWARLRGLGAELRSALPVPPPPELDAQVLQRLSREPRRWTRWLAFAAVAAAAAVAISLATTWPRGPSELVLTEGVAEVDGRARVLAADAVVEVDGLARISVEPIDDLDRGTLSGGGTMSIGRRTFSAGPGLVVTVVVLGGTATVRAADPPPPAAAPPVPAADMAAPNVAAENAVLRKLLADQEAELQGTPVPWPSALPEALTPAGFERRVREAVSRCAPAVRVVSVECTEPPCLALLRAPRGQSPYGDGRTWYDDLVNDCPAWTDAYTSEVAWASGTVDCADGTTDRYDVLGWSTALAPDRFPAAERENRSKRFQTRIDEIRRGWTCDE
jgi:hypothetical protein